MAGGDQFLIQPAFVEAASRRQVAVSSPSHRLSEPVADWVRRKIFLSDLRGSAVRQRVFGKRKKGIEAKR